MGCKNCKSQKAAQKLSSEFVNNTQNINESLQKRKMEILKSSWNKSMGSFYIKEQLALTLFAWVPLILGYYTIIKFLINLF
jgi:hypothetical protein